MPSRPRSPAAPGAGAGAATPEQARRVVTPIAAVRTSGLSRSYGDVLAVDGLDLTVERGEIYGFLGLNGAGKTTTIRMLLGMIRPSAGQASLLGTPVRRGGRGPWDRVGYLVDAPAPTPGSPCSRIWLGGAPARHRRRCRDARRRAARPGSDMPSAGRTPVAGQPPAARARHGSLPRARARHPRRAGQRPRSGRRRRSARSAAFARHGARRHGPHVQPHPRRGGPAGDAHRDHPPRAADRGAEHARRWRSGVHGVWSWRRATPQERARCWRPQGTSRRQETAAWCSRSRAPCSDRTTWPRRWSPAGIRRRASPSSRRTSRSTSCASPTLKEAS